MVKRPSFALSDLPAACLCSSHLGSYRIQFDIFSTEVPSRSLFWYAVNALVYKVKDRDKKLRKWDSWKLTGVVYSINRLMHLYFDYNIIVNRSVISMRQWNEWAHMHCWKQREYHLDRRIRFCPDCSVAPLGCAKSEQLTHAMQWFGNYRYRYETVNSWNISDRHYTEKRDTRQT